MNYTLKFIHLATNERHRSTKCNQNANRNQRQV